MVKHTETSPLLKKHDIEDSSTPQYVDPEGGAEPAADVEQEPKKNVNIYVLFPAIAIGIALSAADQTLIVSSFGKIGSELKALNNISWIATAYFITLTAFQPLYGKLSNIFGRKACLLYAYAVFGSGCVLCGLARNLWELVAARAFSGVGAGGMSTVVTILVSDHVSLEDRGVWQGYINIMWAVGGSAGAPLGGIFADTIGWRWLFIGQGPLCAIAFIAVYFILESDFGSHMKWSKRLRQIDLLGALTLVSAVFFLLLGLDRGSNVSWLDKIMLGSCGLAIILFALFVLVEVKVAAHPFAPGHIIFGRDLFANYLVNFNCFSAHLLSLFYVPLYLQAALGLSASATGKFMIPSVLFSVVASNSSGKYMKKTGKYYCFTICTVVSMVFGSIIVVLCSGLVATLPVMVIVGLSFSAIGQGGSVTTTLISTLANSEPSEQAVAVACTYLFRTLGSIIGITLASTVVQQMLRTLLKERLESGHEAERIVMKVRESLEYIKVLDPKTREIVVRCYQKATNAAFGLAVGFAIMGLVSSFWIKESKLKR